jgi:hypothetical protein
MIPRRNDNFLFGFEDYLGLFKRLKTKNIASEGQGQLFQLSLFYD